MRICEPKTKKEFEKYYTLRWKILRKPWNQPKGSEKDELENESIHVMIFDEDTKKDNVKNNIPIGVGRLHFNSKDEAQIRYMAVEGKYQGKGLGSLLLKDLEKRAKSLGTKYIILNSRENAVKFYEKNGYKVVEKAHVLFDSIKHFKMRKKLS